jgi:hypothetical protein
MRFSSVVVLGALSLVADARPSKSISLADGPESSERLEKAPRKILFDDYGQEPPVYAWVYNPGKKAIPGRRCLATEDPSCIEKPVPNLWNRKLDMEPNEAQFVICRYQ